MSGIGDVDCVVDLLILGHGVDRQLYIYFGGKRSDSVRFRTASVRVYVSARVWGMIDGSVVLVGIIRYLLQFSMEREVAIRLAMHIFCTARLGKG